MSLIDIMTAGRPTPSRILGRMRPSAVGLMVIEMTPGVKDVRSQAQPIGNTEKSMLINEESSSPGQGDKDCSL